MTPKELEVVARVIRMQKAVARVEEVNTWKGTYKYPFNVRNKARALLAQAYIELEYHIPALKPLIDMEPYGNDY